MNAHVIMVLYTGIVFVSSGACLLEICRLLGKAYENKPSAHPAVRLAHFVGAVILFAYGVIVLFPGQAMKVQHMSVGLPLVGTVVVGFFLGYLDHVMGEREPPRWTVQMVRVLALVGLEGLSRRAAFMLPPAPIDAAPPEEAPGPRAQRLAVIGGAITLIGLIAGTILINATA